MKMRDTNLIDVAEKFNCFYQNTRYEISTPNGFQDFDGLLESNNNIILEITIEGNSTLKCTLDHKIYISDNEYKLANELHIHDLIQTDEGLKKIINIEKKYNKDLLTYDLLDVKNGNRYYTFLDDGNDYNKKPYFLCGQCLYLDEMAFINDIDTFFASTYPVVTAGKTTKILITSCVIKDTYVYTDKGIKQVKDFIDITKPVNPKIGYEILPYNIQGLNRINQGTVMVNSGIAKTKIIKTKSSILEASLNHKLWACKEGKFDWYEIKDLTTNDYISLNVGCNLWANNNNIDDFVPYQTNKSQNLYIPTKELTKDMMYFLGLFIAEGYINVKNDAVIISCGDDILSFLDFLKLPFKKVDDVHYRVTSKSLRLFMEYIGFDLTKKSKEKIIPTRLLECSLEHICSLLSGLFDGDGCITKRGTLNYTSTSKILIEQIRMLLLNLGITTQLYSHTTKPTKKVKVSSLVYSLEINSYKDCKYFLDIIGFRLRRKQEREKLLTIPKKLITNDLIPYGRILLKENNIEIPKKWNNKKTHHISKEFCLSLWHESEKLKDIIHPNIKWEKILSLTDSENEVFDFSLPDILDNFGNKIEHTHSIIYNGIIGHQTPLGLNLFYKMYKEAEEGKNGFDYIKAIWSDHPDRDEQWGKDQLAILGPNKFAQEMESTHYDTLVNINGQEIQIGDLYNDLMS